MQLMIAETDFQEFKRTVWQSLTEGYRVIPGTLSIKSKTCKEMKRMGITIKSEYFVVFLERED